MRGIRTTVSDWGVRGVLFRLFVLLGLAIWAVLLQGWRNTIFLVTSWVGGIGLFPQDFLEIGHRLHEFSFALLLWPFVVGHLAQLRSPRRHVTGMLMAVATLLAMLAGFAATGFWKPAMVLVFLGVPTLLAALLHPAGRELLTTLGVDSVNRPMLALVVVAAVPLLLFATTQIGLQTGAIEPAAHEHGGASHGEVHEQHVKFGHFALTTSFLFGLVFTALLASFQQRGWWLAAWLAGLMMVVYAVGGLLAPEAASNPGAMWNVAAILWGLAFVAVAETTQSADRPTLLGARRSRTYGDW